MEQWNQLVNTAMLGTDKRPLAIGGAEGALQEAVQLVQQSTADREEQFLQLAAILNNYRQSGAMPYPKVQALASYPQPEEKPYCSTFAIRVLQDAIHAESNGLMRLWFSRCVAAHQLVTPDMLPIVLSMAEKNRGLREQILICTGKRGEWLGQLNPDWQFGIGADASLEDRWQNGSAAERAEALKIFRNQDPQAAIALLQQTWASEPAETKQLFLDALFVTLSNGDVPFLESLSAEKSKKVKDDALRLLKRIPGSAIIRQHAEAAVQSFSIKEEKKLLGLSTKKVLEWTLAPVADNVYKSGIEKMSSQKNVKDEDYILYQLMCYTPPHLFEQHLQLAPEQIIALFKQTKGADFFIPAFSRAAARFKNSDWAKLLVDEDPKYADKLMYLLEPAQREKYLVENVVSLANSGIFISSLPHDEEWSVALASAMLEHASRNPYQFTKPFYKETADRMPLGIADKLEKKFAPEEEHLQNAWKGYADLIRQQLSIKQQIINAFKA